MRSKIFFCTYLCCCPFLFAFGQLQVSLVITKIPAVKDQDVHLFAAGDFNNWNPGDARSELEKLNDGSWRLKQTLPQGVYNFKITRGNWQKVESSADGKAVDNRSFALVHDTAIILTIAGWQDNFKAEQKKHTASSNVHIITEEFDMPRLGRYRRLWIYLPPDYESSRKKYPVIYMHDGQNLFDSYTSAYGEWGIDEMMDKLPAKERCIIIGVDHGGQDRMQEYNPYDSKYGPGKGDDYVDFLVKTLKPYVDSHYRCKTDARYTTIAGSSMGGLISMYAILKYPDVFGNAGIFSPSFWIAPKMYTYAEQHASTKSRFYFVCGNAEGDGMAGPMDEMVKLVRSKGISERNSPETVVTGGQHNEKQWNADFPGFYKWLFENKPEFLIKSKH